MPEKIEQILRAIHILFSKGEMYHEFPDKVLVSKRELYDLLEQLNYAVVEVMDQYEATTRSKEKAKQQLEAEGKKIVDAASQEAEDVYAASMLYTDNALEDLSIMVEETKSSLRTEYSRFEDALQEQLEQIRLNQSELMQQLQALSQGKKYLDIINTYNTEQTTAETMNSGEVLDPGDWISKSEIARLTDEQEAERKKRTKSAAKPKNKLPDAVIPERLQMVKESGGKVRPVKKQGGKTAIAAEKEQEAPHTRKLPPVQAEDEEEEYEALPVKQKIEVKVYSGSGMPDNSIFNTSVLKTKKERKKEEKYGKPVNSETGELQDAETVFSPEELDAEYEQWQQEQDNDDRKNRKEKHGFFEKLIGKGK